MLLALSLAHAADTVPAVTVDGQLYRAPMDARSTLWADDASLRPGVRAGAVVGWVHEPVVWVWQDSGERVPLVGDAVGLDLLASYTFWRIRAGVDVPVYPFASGNEGSGGGLGDLALDVKGVVLEEDEAPLGLAIAFRADLPTASTAVPLAAGGFAYELTVIADKKVGPILLAANIGTRGLPAVDVANVAVGDELAWRLGAGFDPGGKAGASLDLAGYATWNDLGNTAGAPAEIMVGGWYKVADSVRLSAGVGHGISSGIGASNGRAVVGVEWAPPAPKEGPKAVAEKPAPRPKDKPVPPAPKPVEKPPAPVAVAKPPPAPTPAPVAVAKPPPAPTPAPVVTPPPAPVPTPVVAPAPAVAVVTPPVVTPTPIAAPVPPAPPAPTAKVPVVIVGNKLVLYQRITFEGQMLTTAGATELEAVSKFLIAHPEIVHVRVEGHTPPLGDPSEELSVAGGRAGLVLDYLSHKGLDRERFTAAGYGSMRPLIPGDDPAAREANERIEFVITKWAEGSAPQ